MTGLPVGLGEPVFSKAKSALIGAVTSVGAVVGATLGDAHHDAQLPGALFHRGVSGSGARAGISSAAHGIQGGITNGERVPLKGVLQAGEHGGLNGHLGAP